MEFPEAVLLPLADWINTITDWMVINLEPFFAFINTVILNFMLVIKDFLLWLPWFVIIIIVAAVAWWFIRRWYIPVIFSVFLFLIGSFGLWDKAMETLALMIVGVSISLVIGIPAGILMSRTDKAETILRPVLDSMQTLPIFVYLIPGIMLLSLGAVPAIIATVIYSVPPAIRLTNAGIRQVPENITEAARAFGATRRQILFDVQLPLAVPSILVGVNQTIMMALAMVVIAAMVGAGGLGQEVLQGLNRLDIGRGFAAGISIVFIAIILDRITSAMATKQQSKGR
jgi:glycine betaine/proline transport system permease protein